MTHRILSTAATTAAVIASIVGCAQEQPEFDPSTRYTPASLAQEFAFRYKSLPKSAPAAAAEPVAGKAVTKGGAVTKAAQATTLDALLDEVIFKAGRMPSLSHAEACKKIAEEVAKDPTFSEGDKKTIAERLGKVSD